MLHNVDAGAAEQRPPAALVRANIDDDDDVDDDDDDVDDFAADANDESILNNRDKLFYDYQQRFYRKVQVCKEFLKDKDPKLYHQFILMENDCWNEYRTGEAGYENLVLSLRQNLFKLIPDVYWSAIEEILCNLEQQEAQEKREDDQEMEQLLQQQDQEMEQLLQQHEQLLQQMLQRLRE